MLVDLLARVRSIQLSSTTGDDTVAPTAHLLSEVRAVVRASVETLAELEAEAYSMASEGVAGAAPALSSSSDDPSGAPVGTAASLADVCFLAVAELRSHDEKLARLGGVDAGSVWSVLAVAEQSLQALCQALSAAESELALVLGVSPRAAACSTLARRLEVRRACGSFRHHVQGAEQEFSADLDAFLRSAVTALVRLRGRQEFLSLALTDRLMVRHLAERVFAWGRSDRDREEGGHLRDEILLFQELLGQVNAEPEVSEHDLLQVSELLEDLQEESLWGPPPLSALERLRTLRGRDAELDRLLADRADIFQLLEALARLRRDLGDGSGRDSSGDGRSEAVPILSELSPSVLTGQEGWS